MYGIEERDKLILLKTLNNLSFNEDDQTHIILFYKTCSKKYILQIQFNVDDLHESDLYISESFSSENLQELKNTFNKYLQNWKERDFKLQIFLKENPSKNKSDFLRQIGTQYIKIDQNKFLYLFRGLFIESNYEFFELL